jgi:hypothetical protein
MVHLLKAQSASAERLLIWYTKHVQAYRTFSKSLFEVNDHVKGVRRGSARSASMQNMIAAAAATDDSTSTVNSSSNHSEKSASAFSLGKNRRNSNSVNPMVPASMKQSSQSDKVIEELCSMDCKTAKAISELCDYLEEEVIAKLQKMAATAAEAVSLSYVCLYCMSSNVYCCSECACCGYVQLYWWHGLMPICMKSVAACMHIFFYLRITTMLQCTI